MIFREPLPVAIGHFRETSYVHVVLQVGKLYRKLCHACDRVRGGALSEFRVRLPVLGLPVLARKVLNGRNHLAGEAFFPEILKRVVSVLHDVV